MRHVLLAAAVLLFIGAGQQTRPTTATEFELTIHPRKALEGFDKKLSIYGLHIGDKYTGVPDGGEPDGSQSPGYMAMTSGFAIEYDMDAMVVTALVLKDYKVFKKIGLRDRYDLDLVLGKPDTSDESHYTYIKKRLVITFSGPAISSMSVR